MELSIKKTNLQDLLKNHKRMQVCVHDVIWKVLPRFTLRCVFLTSPVKY